MTLVVCPAYAEDLAPLAAPLAPAEPGSAPVAPSAAPPPPLVEPPEASSTSARPLLPPPPPPRRSRTAALPAPEVKPPPEPPRHDRQHDGFYFRFSGGPVYARTKVQTDRLSQPDVSLRALGAAFELWVGGTLRPGIVIGGLLMGRGGESDDGVVGDEKGVSSTFGGSQLGVFLDAYPNPGEGYHFGGILAAGRSSLETDAGAGLASTKFDGQGVGVAVFAGLDAWIAEQWSAGVLLRLGGDLTREQSKVDGIDVTKQGTTYAATVLGTILYH